MIVRKTWSKVGNAARSLAKGGMSGQSGPNAPRSVVEVLEAGSGIASTLGGASARVQTERARTVTRTGVRSGRRGLNGHHVQ